MRRCATAQCFLVEHDSVAAAAGVLAVHDGVAVLAGRARGPDSAARARSWRCSARGWPRRAGCGCDLAMMSARPGSNSQRNAERHGFRIAYTRIKWRLAR